MHQSKSSQSAHVQQPKPIKAMKQKKALISHPSQRSITTSSSHLASASSTPPLSLIQRSMATKKAPKTAEPESSTQSDPVSPAPAPKSRKKAITTAIPEPTSVTDQSKHATKKSTKGKAKFAGSGSQSDTPADKPQDVTITPPVIATKASKSLKGIVTATDKAVPKKTPKSTKSTKPSSQPASNLPTEIAASAEQATGAVAATIAKILSQSDRSSGTSVRRQLKNGQKVRFSPVDEQEAAEYEQQMQDPSNRPNTQQTDVDFKTDYSELFQQARDEIESISNQGEGGSVQTAAKGTNRTKLPADYHHPDQFHDPSHYEPPARSRSKKPDLHAHFDHLMDHLTQHLHSNAPPTQSDQASNAFASLRAAVAPKPRKAQPRHDPPSEDSELSYFESQIDPTTGLPMSTSMHDQDSQSESHSEDHLMKKKFPKSKHITFSSGISESEQTDDVLDSFMEEIDSQGQGHDDDLNSSELSGLESGSELTSDQDGSQSTDPESRFGLVASSPEHTRIRRKKMKNRFSEDESTTDDIPDHIHALHGFDGPSDDLDDMDDDELREKILKLKSEGRISAVEIEELHNQYHEMRQAEIEAQLSGKRDRGSKKSNSQQAHLDALLASDNEDHDADTSEFTTTEIPTIHPPQHQHNQEMANVMAKSSSSEQQQQQQQQQQQRAASDDKPPTDKPNGHHGDNDGGDSNQDNQGGDGGDGNEKGNGPQRDKRWPQFDKDVYSRVYRPHASTSPKLSSALILPLSHTIRPLFPGLYCPVVVTDPAIVTQILKQTNKGFPYVGVFMKKGKDKDDSFLHKTTIHSTDRKKPPLFLNAKAGAPASEDNTVSGSVDPDNLHHIGTFAHIFNITHLPNGAIHMILVGLRRIELDSVKYDIVPDLDAKGINALANAILPSTQESSSGSKKNRQSESQLVDRNTSKHDHLPAVVPVGKQITADSPITAPHAGQSKSDYGKQLLDVVMETGISKYPEYSDPSIPTPPQTKRVLIGNITHFDEETLYSSLTHEDGTPKSPLELSRDEQTLRVYSAEILHSVRELLHQSTPGILEQLQFLMATLDLSQPGLVADFFANFTNASGDQMQKLLSTLDIKKRLHLTLLLIKREVEMSFIHTEIQKSVEEQLQKTHREFYLRQQLTQIKKELGQDKDGGDSKLSLPNKFKSRVKERWDYIPQYAKTIIEEELSKLETLDTSSSEYNVTRNYLEWLTVLPWDHSTDEIYDISRTEQTLNEEHYGMQDVKDRILEFVAVGKLLQKQQEAAKKKKAEEEEVARVKAKEEATRQSGGTSESFNIDGADGSPVASPGSGESEFIISIKKDADKKAKSKIFTTDEFAPKSPTIHQAATGKIMLFVGPPGVGKTSIGRSIAKSLNREFYRFSVGGLSDVSEIKGHRRTYVGALPGKIVQALKKTQCSNPVILIDEIDKIGRSSNHGDPSSALLEVLDPEQNATFVDHYMDIPLDLSKVLFICTANSLDTISGPLKDRMDIVQLSGYIQQEKEHIAKHYIEPQLLERCGLTKDEAEITMPTISHLVKWYCREAGVRRLQKYMEMIYRKVAFRVVRNDTLPIRVTPENLSEYIGQELYQSDRMYERTPVGVVAGLAWSRAGGSTMYIESAISQNVFNRKKWGLSEIKKGGVAEVVIGDEGKPLTIVPRDSTSNSNPVDAIEIFDVIGGNKVKSTVDVVTKDTSIIIESNDKPKGPSDSNNKNTLDKSDVIIPTKKEDDKKDDKKKDDDDEKEGGNGSLKLTGSLGEVMKESASIAYTLSKFYLHKLYAEYETHQLAFRKQHNLPLDTSISTTLPLPDNIKQELDLTQQDDPIDPLYCKIPVLRPPLSNSSTTASKVAGTHLNVRQSDLQRKSPSQTQLTPEAEKLQKEMDQKLAELHTLQSQIERMGKISACEDDLFAAEVQPIVHENPQRSLSPGATYTTPSTLTLPKRLLQVPDPNFFNTAQIHIHAPQGATPKDGPSAGIALLSCLLSQALNRPLVNNIAMTGEISLTGKVLPIGGLREKILGARQSNIFHLIVPKSNMHDIAELPAFITSGLTIYFAESADEVIRLVFGAPHALSPNPLKPTLIKKYDTYEGDVDLEILKYQSEQAKKQKEQREQDEKPVPITEAEIVQ